VKATSSPPSRDLRTPIHILVGYADMLLDGVAGELVDEQRKLVDSIHERSLQFRDLVDGILAVAGSTRSAATRWRRPSDSTSSAWPCSATRRPPGARRRPSLSRAPSRSSSTPRRCA
jgi:hypothetical protein